MAWWAMCSAAQQHGYRASGLGDGGTSSGIAYMLVCNLEPDGTVFQQPLFSTPDIEHAQGLVWDTDDHGCLDWDQASSPNNVQVRLHAHYSGEFAHVVQFRAGSNTWHPLTSIPSNHIPTGIMFKDSVLYYVDLLTKRVYALAHITDTTWMARDDLGFPLALWHDNPGDLWHSGNMIWIVDRHPSLPSIYAYTISGDRRSHADIPDGNLTAAGNPFALRDLRERGHAFDLGHRHVDELHLPLRDAGQRLMIAQPSRTFMDAIQQDAFTVAEAKQLLGVPDNDNQHDEELENIFRAAQEYVSKHLARTYASSTRDDFYEAWASGLQLSADLPGATVTVTYHDADDAEQTVAAADYAVDKSASPTVINFGDAPALELSNKRVNPIKVAYSEGINFTPDAATPADRHRRRRPIRDQSSHDRRGQVALGQTAGRPAVEHRSRADRRAAATLDTDSGMITNVKVLEASTEKIDAVRCQHVPATESDEAAIDFISFTELRRFVVASIPSTRDMRPGFLVEYPATSSAANRHRFRIVRIADDGANVVWVCDRQGYAA